MWAVGLFVIGRQCRPHRETLTLGAGHREQTGREGQCGGNANDLQLWWQSALAAGELPPHIISSLELMIIFIHAW